MTLKRSGPHLEHLYKDQLDKLGIALRNACRDDELDLVSDVMGCDVMGGFEQPISGEQSTHPGNHRAQGYELAAQRERDRLLQAEAFPA